MMLNVLAWSRAKNGTLPATKTRPRDLHPRVFHALGIYSQHMCYIEVVSRYCNKKVNRRPQSKRHC